MKMEHSVIESTIFSLLFIAVLKKRINSSLVRISFELNASKREEANKVYWLHCYIVFKAL